MAILLLEMGTALAKKGKMILIVDDDESARVLCDRELRAGGYDTHLASSGLEALKFLNNNPQVDLIILDVKMPSMDGIEVLKKLRANEINIPVILYSDYKVYKGNFLSWLADSYMIKSSDFTELKKKVKELLNVSRTGD